MDTKYGCAQVKDGQIKSLYPNVFDTEEKVTNIFKETVSRGIKAYGELLPVEDWPTFAIIKIEVINTLPNITQDDITTRQA